MIEPRPNSNTAPALARPYAKAAFDYAQQAKDTTGWETRMEALSQAVTHAAPQLLRSPDLKPAQVKEVLDSAMDKLGMTQAEKNFVNVLIDNKRLSILPWVHEEFVKLHKNSENIIDVTITSAFEVTKQQLEKLTASIEKKFNIKAAPTIKIDPSLIGGVRIQMGDKVYDASLKGKLDRLKNHLRK